MIALVSVRVAEYMVGHLHIFIIGGDRCAAMPHAGAPLFLLDAFIHRRH